MRIALVEPSRTARLIFGRMLEARGHEVLPFSDELEALAQIKADLSIDALIRSAELKTRVSSFVGRRASSRPAGSTC